MDAIPVGMAVGEAIPVGVAIGMAIGVAVGVAIHVPVPISMAIGVARAISEAVAVGMGCGRAGAQKAVVVDTLRVVPEQHLLSLCDDPVPAEASTRSFLTPRRVHRDEALAGGRGTRICTGTVQASASQAKGKPGQKRKAHTRGWDGILFTGEA